MLMVINSKLAHDALRQFKPPAACAETLELRHFNFAQMRHDNFALAPEMSIIDIMSNRRRSPAANDDRFTQAV